MNTEIESLLVDVRRAYRLLAIYQRRLLDLGTNAAVLLGFEFGSWAPQTNRPAATQSDPSERWVWDLLPAHRAKFNYQPKVEPSPSEWMLTIDHDPDTGFRSAGSKEPDPALFEPAMASRSLIKLHAFAIKQGSLKGDGGRSAHWYSIWNAAKYAPADDRPWIGQAAGCEVIAVRQTHSFAELADESALRQSLVDLQERVAAHLPTVKRYLTIPRAAEAG